MQLADLATRSFQSLQCTLDVTCAHKTNGSGVLDVLIKSEPECLPFCLRNVKNNVDSLVRTTNCTSKQYKN